LDIAMGDENSTMQDLSISELLEQFNFIVPEIQREYVWGNNNGILLNFFNDLKERKLANIGFLYSYTPQYGQHKKEEREDVYLIDGQQRFTTIFLTLFYFAIKEDQIADFNSIFNVNEAIGEISFDYRVRTLTHLFILEMISKCKNLNDLNSISDKNWFLFDYSNDLSIKAILNTLKFLNGFFMNDPTDYYTYLKKEVSFWHFKTEATSQGEQLYITMNSRGEALAENEKQKAHLFENIHHEKIEWGKKWEFWLDFFWKINEKEKNADIWFNEFLIWVDEIEKLTRKNKIIDLDFPIVEEYFKALFFLINVQDDIVKQYPKIQWFDFKSALIEKPSEEKKRTLYFALVYIKGNSFISYSNEIGYFIDKLSDFEKKNIFRVIRFFYNRFRSSEAINEAITLIGQLKNTAPQYDITDAIDIYSDSYKNILNPEERYKLQLFKDHSIIREQVEVLIWKTEDNKFTNGQLANLFQLMPFEEHTLDNFELNDKYDYSISQFDFEKFNKISESLYKLLPKQGYGERLWGNFLSTSLYETSINDPRRVVWEGGDHDFLIIKNKDFLKMLIKVIDKDIDFFLEQNEKAFFRKYTFDELVKTKDKKIQLFAYFLILRQKETWDWNKGYNFGSEDMNNKIEFHCLFDDKIKFQQYESSWGGAAWRFLDYTSFSEGKNELKELIKWANKP